MKKEDNKTADAKPQSPSEVNEAISRLQGGDRVGNAGQIVATAGGAAAGVAAGGTVAAAAGATTLFGSTTLASALGGILVVTTPVGWIIGCSIAGAAAAYGISRLIRSGGRNDRVRQEIIERLSKRLKAIQTVGTNSIEMKQLRQYMSVAVKDRLLSNEQATRMVDLIEKGRLDVNLALTRVRESCPE
jgi:hypothetical protein